MSVNTGAPQPPLDGELERLGIGSVVLAGFMTHAWINSTARGACNLGYHAAIVANATATRDLPSAGGGVAAEHVQVASLAAAGEYVRGDCPRPRSDWLICW